MKKILLTTSALVAMSSLAVSGETVAPNSSSATDFKIEIEGEMTIFSYHEGANKTSGLGGEAEIEIEATKTVKDGANLSGVFGVDNETFNIELEYSNSSIGTLKAGSLGGADEHDVEVPDSPSHPEADIDVSFADADISFYTSFDFDWAVPDKSDYAVTYATPVISGFQFGAGVAGDGEIDLALTGKFEAGAATIKLGAGVTGNGKTLSDTGIVTIGAAAEISNLELAENLSMILLIQTIMLLKLALYMLHNHLKLVLNMKL